MTKNITLKIDEEVLKLCRYEAVESDKSLSRWVTDILVERIKDDDEYKKAKERAVQRIMEGRHLGGAPLGRNEAHRR